MLQQNTAPKKSSIGQWLFLLAMLLVVLVVWLNKQWIIDFYHYTVYSPTNSIRSLASNISLTEQGRFLFYASRPHLSNRTTFNSECERKEADSPVLGCYNMQRIYVFDITNEKLDGIEEVTAAHELLHAVYERLPQSKKDELGPLLKKNYERLKTKELAERMAYYEKNEPGEELNELYAILPTEFENISKELDEHYKTYFSNRSVIVSYHDASHGVFAKLSDRANTIADRIDRLVDSINEETKQYNKLAARVSREVEAFNERADQTGSFESDAEFQAARGEVIAKVDALKAQRSSIQSDIALYKRLRSELEAISAESTALNRSIDSNLAPATTL